MNYMRELHVIVGNIFLEFIQSAADSSWVAAALEAGACLLPLSHNDHDGDGGDNVDDEDGDEDDLDSSLNKVDSSANFSPVLWYCRLSHPEKHEFSLKLLLT